MQFSLEESAPAGTGSRLDVLESLAASSAIEKIENGYVPRRIEHLELPCRYSIVYELTRIDYMLNVPKNVVAEKQQSWMMSISA